MRIPHKALILVGDGRKALFLRNEGSPGRPDLRTEDVLAQDNPSTAAQGADRPGRRADRGLVGQSGPGSGPGPRSAMEQTDWHQLAEDRFAREIADALLARARTGGFDALVVALPPRALGVFRAALHDTVRARLHGEVAKDLTNHSIPEIIRVLSD